MSEHDISSNETTVWINAADGSCIARFGRYGINVHTTVSAQMAGASQCLACTHEETHLEDWHQFTELMRRHYTIMVTDKWMPKRIRKEQAQLWTKRRDAK